MGRLLSIPVEIIAVILGILDLSSLVAASATCRLLRSISSDPLLNPWRQPILRSLRAKSPSYPAALQNLSVYSTVPRRNWIEILSLARIDFLLFEATLPNLEERDWEEAFNRRFLPSWRKWKKEGKWKEAFLKLSWRIYHRITTSCTTNEAWSNYIVLNRTGSVNSCYTSSRSFDPVMVFDDMKIQKNLSHLETSARILVRFADVRIIAFGTLHTPNSLFINANARMLIHPPGVEGPPGPYGIPEELLREREEEVIAPPPLAPLPILTMPTTQPSPPSSPHSHSFTAFFRTRSRDMEVVSTQTPPSPSTSHGVPFLRSLSRDTDSGQGSSPTRSFLRHLVGSASTSEASGSHHQNRAVPIPTPAPIQTNQSALSSALPQSLTPPSPEFVRPIAPSSMSRAPKAMPEHDDTPASLNAPYTPLRYPLPYPTHQNYPNYTVGGQDYRWTGFGPLEEDGKIWVGPMLLAAQLVPSITDDKMTPESFETDILERHQGRWASFGWEDLWACAPWMKERVARRVDGLGLGVEADA